MGILKHKIRYMSYDSANDAIDQPITLENEYTPDTSIFAAAAPVANAADDAATPTIAPDAHFLSSGLKLYTELFSKGKINNMADKDTINATPAPNAPNSDNPDAVAQYYGSADSNSPYSLRNLKFPPYSTNTMKNQKKKENKIDDEV